MFMALPDGAAEARGRQKAALAEMKHREATSTAHGDAITAAEAAGAAAGCRWRAAVIRDARRDYNDSIRLPAELKAKEAELGARGKALQTTCIPPLSQLLNLTAHIRVHRHV